MDGVYTLNDMVGALQEAFRAQQGYVATARIADECLRRALRTPDFLEACPAFDRAQTNVNLYKDPEFGFVIQATTIKPGLFRMPHDHGPVRWSVYGAYRNQTVQRLYRRFDDGMKDGYAEVERAGECRLSEGETSMLLPGDIHQDGNPGAAHSTSIVIRERSNREFRNVFYPERRLVKSTKEGIPFAKSFADFDAYFLDLR